MDSKLIAKRIIKLAEAVDCDPVELLGLIQDNVDIDDPDAVYEIIKQSTE